MSKFLEEAKNHAESLKVMVRMLEMHEKAAEAKKMEESKMSSPQRRALMEKKYETQEVEIDGEKIKQKKGKLSDDLGKPAFQASQKELDDYINAASGAEKQKRVARVNLMKAYKKGHKAQGH